MWTGSHLLFSICMAATWCVLSWKLATMKRLIIPFYSLRMGLNQNSFPSSLRAWNSVRNVLSSVCRWISSVWAAQTMMAVLGLCSAMGAWAPFSLVRSLFSFSRLTRC